MKLGFPQPLGGYVSAGFGVGVALLGGVFGFTEFLDDGLQVVPVVGRGLKACEDAVNRRGRLLDPFALVGWALAIGALDHFRHPGFMPSHSKNVPLGWWNTTS